MNTIALEKTPLADQSVEFKPWYKQFWPWFLISLPLSAVIAGIATIVIAMDKPDGLVADDYYKQGLGINRELAREQLAQQLEISALLQLSGKQLSVALDGKMPLPDKLNIYFIHPTRAQSDKHWILVKTRENLYTSNITSLSNVNWHLKIEPDQGHWRLNGRYNPQQTEPMELKALK